MKLALATLVAALIAAPVEAHAGTKLRLGAEAVLGSHDSSGWTSLTDRFLVSPELMIGWTTPLDILSVDVEIAEQFITNPNRNINESSRVGTTLRPGITISPPVVPIYFRAAIPLHIEPSPFQSYARAGVGFTFGISTVALYVEGDADFPLFGSDGSQNINGVPTNRPAPDPFSQQIFSAGAGLQFLF
jgi:hypothetical protein